MLYLVVLHPCSNNIYKECSVSSRLTSQIVSKLLNHKCFSFYFWKTQKKAYEVVKTFTSKNVEITEADNSFCDKTAK